ncbi:type II and III secretion system protein family protein [Ferrimonas pelagia]|uniref:Pilus assembly protein N-terminal domain-containing protein n=1 Tax=Ferrimonas pelagia TaxID=1177826 RepID=A0ABP9FGP0_9GAMM
MKALRTISLLLILIGAPIGHAMQILNLSEGGAHPLSFSSNVGTVFISDTQIADYQVVDANHVVIFGKRSGASALIVYDENGETLLSRHLEVNKSLVSIQQQIQLRYPDANVTVFNLGEQTVLSGKVATEKDKDEIHQLVGELLAKSPAETKFEWQPDGSQGSSNSNSYPLPFLTKRSYPGLVNQIEVAMTRQVNVKLTIAEVSHSFMESFGIQLGSDGNPGVFIDQLTSFSASDIVSIITAIGDDTVGQILAEPNLSVISNETASFLVGGELPIVTIVDGGTNVEYKEFGVKLDVSAKVMRDDKIMLALMPEVSALDTQYSNELYSLPALKTRRARTTIELADGQSFMLAGLINSEDKELLRRIPFIGDIPVLGALFRHTLTERSKTELVIVATVNLIQPVAATQVQLPYIQRSSTLHRFFGVKAKQRPQPWVEAILSDGGFKL